MDQKSLKIKTIRNIGWLMGLKFSSKILAFFAQIVYMIYLSREEFGILALGMVIMELSWFIGDFQISSALIQRKNATNEFIYTGATLRLLLSFWSMIILFISGPYIALFLNNPGAGPVIQALSVFFVLNNAGFVPTILLTRELNFKRLTIANAMGNVTSTIFAVALVILNFSYWGIIIGAITGAIVTIATLFLIVPYKVYIKFTINKQYIKEIVRFCIYLVPIPFLTYISFNIDKYFISYYFGASVLGLYTVAWKWGTFLTFNIGEIVSSVTFPTFSRIKDIRQLKKGYLLTCRYLGYILFPAAFFIVATADELLILILGGGTTKWQPVVIPLQFFALFGLILGILYSTGSLFVAEGYPKINLRQTIIYTLSNIIALLIGIIYFRNVEILAGLYLLMTLPWAIWVMELVSKVAPIKISEILNEYIPSALSALFIFPLVFVIRSVFGFTINSFFIQMAIAAGAYFIMMNLLTKNRFFEDIKTIIKSVTG